MISSEPRTLRIAILDLYEGQANQGMRCIRQIIKSWSVEQEIAVYTQEFNVRQEIALPDLSFDIYVSSGGPGDPLTTRFMDWDIAWSNWLKEVLRFNSNPANADKKQVFFICHSFQLASRQFNAGIVCKRKSTAFGVFPVHMLEAGKNEDAFRGLRDPFYAVDSRDYQVIQPNHALLREMGGEVLCIEKSRPHVPYERAIMGIRFNENMIGTQFHPEADAQGMSLHLQTEEKKKTVVDNYGEEKFFSMIHQLNDPDKIVWTYSHILPNFLNLCLGKLESAAAVA